MKFYQTEHHTTRVIKKFAFLPIFIRTWSQGSLEIRWLEQVIIEQKYYIDGYGLFGGRWRNEQFLN